MRLAQKMIQGDKFDIEKALAEEEKQGKPMLVAPTRPEYNVEITQEHLDKMIRFGSHVMGDKEHLDISLSAISISRARFKQSSESHHGAS